MLVDRRTFLHRSAALGGMLLTGCGVGGPGGPIPIRKTGPFDDLLDTDALGLAASLRSRELSRVELVELVIRRIEAIDPILNFMTTRAYERARERAAGPIPADAPFAGVPILIKDLVDVGGLPRTDGSKLMVGNIPDKNVAYIDAVEAAGFNILGLTNVPEFATSMATDNDLFGATLNPWNLAYSPFTSSGGSAAAVAAGVVPLAHGTDGAGSNRLPASITGLFGFKASRQRMLSGEANGGHDRTKTNQAISRTVRDSAALMDLTEDKTGARFAPIGLVEGPSAQRLKIGYAADAPGVLDVDPLVRAAMEDSIEKLQALGHEVVDLAYPADAERYLSALNLFASRKLATLGALVRTRTGKTPIESGVLTRNLASRIEAWARVDAAQLEGKVAYLDELPASFAQAFQDVDLLMSPVSPIVGIPYDEFSADDTYDLGRANLDLAGLKFTGPVNFAGNPAMSVPLSWGVEDGLPVGTHFVAAVGRERTLYELAYELEAAYPWADRWAPHSLKFQ
jgi:amidase